MFFVLCWGAFSVCIFGKENFPAVNRCLYDVLYFTISFLVTVLVSGTVNFTTLLQQFSEPNEERHLLMVQLGCSASELTGKNKSLK